MTVIDHGGGLTSAYAHQSRFARGPGPIRQGDILGYVGASGTVTGPHLHLEIRVNGVPQNPRGWLPGGNASQRTPAC
jgi:murein DD-endopeptidase MepM/ murein hydrolase activator NlpD